MQKRGHFAVLVKGLFSPAKNSFLSVLSPNNKSRAFLPHRSNRGAGPKFLSRPHRAIWGSAPAGTCLPPAPWKLNTQHQKYVNPAVGLTIGSHRSHTPRPRKSEREIWSFETETAFQGAMKRRRIMILPSSHSTEWNRNQAMRAAPREPRRDENSMRSISCRSFLMLRRDGYRG